MRFVVDMEQIRHTQVEVDAETPEEAKEKACGMDIDPSTWDSGETTPTEAYKSEDSDSAMELEKGRRARLIYCLDYIMHALNDEEDISSWLQNHVPDGTMYIGGDLTDYQVAGFADLDVGQEAFDQMVAEFVATLFAHTFPRQFDFLEVNDVPLFHYARKVLV